MHRRHTRTGIVEVLDGIVRFVPAPGVHQDADGARENVATAADLLGPGARAPIVVDLRQVGELDREARQVYANGQAWCMGQAIVVGSAFSRIVGNLFLRLERMDFPVRLFDSVEEAERWARGLLGEGMAEGGEGEARRRSQ